MKIENNQNQKLQTPADSALSSDQLKAYLTSADYNELVQNHLNDFLSQANSSLSELQKQADATPTGPLKTAIEGAIGALNEKKESLASIFKDVVTYSVFGMWQMAKTEMNNIDATQTAQNQMMLLDQSVETAAVKVSNYFTATVLKNDIDSINAEIDPNNHDSDDQKTRVVNSRTSTFNLDNTKMSTLGTFFSGINNSTNNVVSAVAQNISVDTSNVSSMQKFYDTLSQILGQ